MYRMHLRSSDVKLAKNTLNCMHIFYDRLTFVDITKCREPVFTAFSEIRPYGVLGVMQDWWRTVPGTTDSQTAW